MPMHPGAQGDHPDSGSVEFEREFAFSDGEERLPWLESDDDEYAPRGTDSGRIAAFAGLGLLALLLIAGALWVIMREKPDETLVADGSVIAAPAQPYRVRPENPGGRQVAGTGDTSFEVGEGKQVEGHIADNVVPAPAPAIELKQAPSIPAATSGIGVQVGAYLDRATAESGWAQLSARLEPLQGRSHRVVEAMVDSGKVFRLQALAGSLDEAQTLCEAVKAAGGDCQVKR
ncbi:MAG: SPOR domain-containing protein [Croceibacterium sp.]